jgi:D-alanine transaminase
MSRTVFVNGSYLPESEGKISIFDRGFLFADGVYEVSTVIGGKMFDFGLHMERLGRSLSEIDMAWPMSKDEIEAMHRELIKRNKLDQGMVYMQVTRGIAERDFKFPKGTKPSIVAFTQAKNVVDSEDAKKGVSVITIPDLRWARRDIKSLMLLAPVLGKEAASKAGAFEAWMTENDGEVTEGTSSNAYIVSGNTIRTRHVSNAILAGCTRRALINLSKETGVVIEEKPFKVAEAYDADEAFLTSATTVVMPVVSIDGKKVGSGKPGPITQKLRQLYLEEALRTAA